MGNFSGKYGAKFSDFEANSAVFSAVFGRFLGGFWRFFGAILTHFFAFFIAIFTPKNAKKSPFVG